MVAPFPTGYWTPEVSAMFDDFWANRRGLLDGWLAAWQVAAQRWEHQRYLMGYDLLNEPWMGIEWPTCLTDGCPASYADRAAAGDGGAGCGPSGRSTRDNIVWWEPQQFAGGQPVDTYFTAPADEEQLGLSWHNYCPGGLPGEPGHAGQRRARTVAPTPTAASSTRSSSPSGCTRCR